MSLSFFTVFCTHQTPGGRVNAKMVSRSTFKHFSMENVEGNAFLRPDRILGAFHVKHHMKFNMGSRIVTNVAAEAEMDETLVSKLEKASTKCEANMVRIEAISLKIKQQEKRMGEGEDATKCKTNAPDIISKRKSLFSKDAMKNYKFKSDIFASTLSVVSCAL